MSFQELGEFFGMHWFMILVLLSLILMLLMLWMEHLPADAKVRVWAKNPKNYPNIVLAVYGCAVAGVCLYTPRISPAVRDHIGGHVPGFPRYPGGCFRGWYFLWQGADLSLDVPRLVLELVIITVIAGVAYLIVRQKASP
jgi:hypothetical protein